jgi:hypothetical protein
MSYCEMSKQSEQLLHYFATQCMLTQQNVRNVQESGDACEAAYERFTGLD